VLYTRPAAVVFPDFWKEAPLERCVIQQEAWMMTGDSAFKVGYRSHRFAEGVPNAYTVLRVRLDGYFAKQARAAGALIISESKVEAVLREGDRVIGVRVGREDGELYAPVVIIAEGVNSELTTSLGMLKERVGLHDAATVVKEVISLDRRVIEDRFHLTGDQGATIEMYGDSTMGMLGTGFLYTNKETLCLGVGALLADWQYGELSAYDGLQRLKAHPMVAPLIAGGRTVEYLSHMIPEGGYDRMPQLSAPGVMITGDAAMLVNGLHREGVNHALLSGKAAADTAIEAHRRGDFSVRTMSHYRERLWEEAPTLKDMKKYRGAARFMQRHPILKLYPELVSSAALEMLTVDLMPKRAKQWKIIRDTLRRRGPFRLVGDAVAAWRSLW
jgi:electron transfer flavoprotein-quinone oxidoreductase